MPPTVDHQSATDAGAVLPAETADDAVLQGARLAQAALDCLATGIVWLDRHGRVGYLNRTAAGYLTARDGLALCGGRLVIRGLAGDELRALLANMRGGAIRVPRLSGKGFYALIVSPAPMAAVSDVGGSGFLVSITCATAAPPVSLDCLCQLWSLTIAEARVACALVEGLSPAEIAERHKVCEATVRCQMRAIFEKTGTSRQAQLVRLVVTCCGVLSGPAWMDA